jgi:hypothetical protein
MSIHYFLKPASNPLYKRSQLLIKNQRDSSFKKQISKWYMAAATAEVNIEK